MKKKTRNILLCLIIPVLVITGILVFDKPGNDTDTNNDSTLPVSPMIERYADFFDSFSDLKSMTGGSDIIIKGDVVDSYTEQRVDMIFTKQIIEVKKVYGGDVKPGDKIEILQTGGEANGINTPPFDETPLFTKGGQYLLFLELTSEGHYLIAGGFQGRADIVKDQVTFSKWNYKMANEFLGISNSFSTATAGSDAIVAPNAADTSNPVPTIISLNNVEAVLSSQGLNIKDSQ